VSHRGSNDVRAGWTGDAKRASAIGLAAERGVWAISSAGSAKSNEDVTNGRFREFSDMGVLSELIRSGGKGVETFNSRLHGFLEKVLFASKSCHFSTNLNVIVIRSRGKSLVICMARKGGKRSIF